MNKHKLWINSRIKFLSIGSIFAILLFTFSCKHDGGKLKPNPEEKLELKTLIIDEKNIPILDEMDAGETTKDRVIVASTASSGATIEYSLTLEGTDKNEWPLGEGNNTLTITVKKGDKQKVYTVKMKKTILPTIISNNLKIKKFYIINANTNERYTDRLGYQYKFDASKGYCKIDYIIPLKEMVEKATFLIEIEDKDIKAKHYFSDTLTSPETIKTWEELSKESYTYITYGVETEVECFAIKNKELDYKPMYLYFVLEKGNEKTYYITDMERKKEASDDVSKISIIKEYRDDEGNSLEEQHPFATKGFIRVMPRNPRAKVELVTPEAKPFTKEGNGYFNTTINLDDDFTRFSYKIISEDGTKEKLYDEETSIFVKQVAINNVRFTYEKETPIYNGKFAKTVDGKKYLNFEKGLIKDKKLYLHIEAFKGVELQHDDFTKLSENTPASFTTTLFEVNVASFIDTAPYTKTFTLTPKYKEKSLQALDIVMLPKDDVISEIEVIGYSATRLLDGKYVVIGEMSAITYGNDVLVDLNLLEGEIPAITNRCIKLFKGTEEMTGVVVDTEETTKLRFKYEGFTISKKETVTLTIKYYEDKANTSTPTKEYTLEVRDDS